MNLLKKLFTKKVKEIPKTGRVINMWEHDGWGDSIYFNNWEERQIVGWMMDRPKIGDILRSKMESGKIARFQVVSVDLKTDPHDMFFAKLKDLNYE